MKNYKSPTLKIDVNRDEKIWITDAYRIYSELIPQGDSYLSKTSYLCNSHEIIDVKAIHRRFEVSIQISCSFDELVSVIIYELCIYARLFLSAQAFHASSVRIDERLLVFIGPSKSGKTFLSKFVANRLGGEIITDDTLILTSIKDKYIVTLDIENSVYTYSIGNIVKMENVSIIFLADNTLNAQRYMIRPDCDMTTFFKFNQKLLRKCQFNYYDNKKTYASAERILNYI